MIGWIYAMLVELFLFILVPVLRVFPHKQKIKKGAHPILLVHGYMNHGNVWLLQKRRLEQAGLGPIFTISLGRPFASISQHAEKVAAMAKEIEKKTGQSDLSLIGHSMGGLVSSFYACKIAPPGTVRKVITLGSPFSGTPLAKIALGKNAREMEPGSLFLKELKSEMESSSLKFYHVAASKDQIVIPGRSALRGDGILFDMGHASLLSSKQVSSKLIEIFQEIEARSPTIEI